jgi:DNA-binding transcriptional MerR regulator
MAKRPVIQGTLDDAVAGSPMPDTELGFGGKQTCEIVGITYRQLDYWDRRDLVKPSLAEAHGSGTQRKYSYRDLVRLRVVKSLLDAGVKLDNARRAIEYLRAEEGADWQTASIVLAGPNSILARDGDALIDLVKQGQGVLNIVPLGAVVGEVDTKILELGPSGAESAEDVDAPGRPHGRAHRVVEGG